MCAEADNVLRPFQLSALRNSQLPDFPENLLLVQQQPQLSVLLMAMIRATV